MSSSRCSFRRFDPRSEHFKVTGGAFEVVHYASAASSTQDTRRRHLLSDVGRADLSRNLAGDLSLRTHLFCTRHGRTSGVDERPPFIIPGAGHDGGGLADFNISMYTVIALLRATRTNVAR